MHPAPEGIALRARFGSGACAYHRVPLLGDVDGLFEYIERSLPPLRRLEGLRRRAFDARAYDQLLYDELGRGGLGLLYRAMLATAQPAVGRALRLTTKADGAGGATLFHCAQGKDRTGVLAMLLQHCTGAGADEIVASYAASEALLEQGGGVAQPEPRREGEGVDWSALRGSPPQAMEQTLAWLDDEFGGGGAAGSGIDRYLDGCGCARGGAWWPAGESGVG